MKKKKTPFEITSKSKEGSMPYSTSTFSNTNNR